MTTIDLDQLASVTGGLAAKAPLKAPLKTAKAPTRVKTPNPNSDLIVPGVGRIVDFGAYYLD